MNFPSNRVTRKIRMMRCKRMDGIGMSFSLVLHGLPATCTRGSLQVHSLHVGNLVDQWQKITGDLVISPKSPRNSMRNLDTWISFRKWNGWSWMVVSRRPNLYYKISYSV